MNIKNKGAKPPAEEGTPQGDQDVKQPKDEDGAPQNKEQGDEAQGKPKDGEGNAYAETDGNSIKSKSKKPKAGTPEHKAQRWEDYKARGGKWDYDRWSKQYNTNMQNARHGLSREQEYRNQLGGKRETIKTKFTNRQIDISNGKYLGQLKTGKMSLTKQAKIDIQKDAWLVKRGYKVEYILEKGASKNFLEALDKAGINYHIGNKIP